MLIRKKKDQRVSINPINRDRSSESEDQQDKKDRQQNGIERPSTLQKTAEGASSRLTALSNLIQSYSSLVGNTRQSLVLNGSLAIEEISKIQQMLKSNLPQSSDVSLPADWEMYYTQPRKTMFLVPDTTETKGTVGAPKEWRPSELHRMYSFISEMSLTKLKADTYKKLQIVYNIHESLVTESPERETDFSPFGWTLKDFITRRNENGTIWIESLLSMGEKELEMLKFKYDMEELFKIIRLLFTATKRSLDGESDNIFNFVDFFHERSQEFLKGLLGKGEACARDLFCSLNLAYNCLKVCMHLWLVLNDQKAFDERLEKRSTLEVFDFLRFPLVLKLEAKRNLEKLHDQVNTYLDMLNFRRGTEEEAYKQLLEARLMDLSVLGPTELRYEINWMETKVDQTIMRMNNDIKEIENQISDCNKEQSKEMYCSRSALDMYYYDIESFKHRIAEMSHRFEQELEQIENEISYKTISLDKLREQRKFLEEQIILFDEEVQRIIQKEIDDQLAEEERKREEQIRALEAAMAKAKKKGKDKNKKK